MACFRASLARVSRRGTPVRITIFTAIVTSVFAGLIPLASIAALANAGTLAAFIAVCAAMLVLRRREPERERKFRAPLRLGDRHRSASSAASICSSACPTGRSCSSSSAQVIGLVLYAIYGSRAAERARAGRAADGECCCARPEGAHRLPAVRRRAADPGGARQLEDDLQRRRRQLAHRDRPVDPRPSRDPARRPLLLHLGRQAVGADRMARGGDLCLRLSACRLWRAWRRWSPRR